MEIPLSKGQNESNAVLKQLKGDDLSTKDKMLVPSCPLFRGFHCSYIHGTAGDHLVH